MTIPDMHTMVDGKLYRLDGPDVWDPPPSDSHTVAPEPDEYGDKVCATCGEDWPCEPFDRVRVYYEDEDRPDDCVPLYRLVLALADEVDR